MAEKERSSMVPYGPPIQEAIAKGDLAGMKQIEAVAEQHLRQVGDVRAALELLRVEIAKLSRKR